MIPAQNIVAWGKVVPWTDPRQVEQDLVISRALVDVFGDETLRGALRVRGGTEQTALPRTVALLGGHRSGAHHVGTDREPNRNCVK